MRYLQKFFPFALACGAALALAACGGASNQTAPKPTITSVTLTLSPNTTTLNPGDTRTITASVNESSGANVSVYTVAFSSDNPNVASVATVVQGTTTYGVITAGTTVGTANITASVVVDVNSTKQSAPLTITVANPPPTLTKITLTPASNSLAPGATQQLTVTGTYSDSSTQVLTSGETFSSSAPATASVNTTGLVSAGSTAGTATITATDTASGKTATATVTVTVPVTLASIALSPLTASILPGATQQLTVTGTYSDNSTKSLAASGEMFTSSNTNVATVSSAGLVTVAANATGGQTAAITAKDTASGLTTSSANSATITVKSPPTLVSIALSPLAKTLLSGSTQQLTVTGTYSDNSTKILINGETFVSDNPAIASVGMASGLVSAGNTAGTAHITATDTASGKTTAVPSAITTTLNPPVLQSIALSPLTASLAPGATQQLTVTGTYNYGPTQTLPASGETFSATPSGVVSISASGLVTVLSSATVGATATITATDTASGLVTSTQNSTLVTVIPSGPDGKVFTNGALDTGITFVPFGGSANTPSSHQPTVDSTTLFTDGTPALKVVIDSSATAPANANFAGGAFVASTPRDLSSFNALTFWAMVGTGYPTKPSLKVQLGDDAGAGVNKDFKIENIGIAVTTSWQQFVIPMVDPTKANGIDGLFSFSDGLNGYTVWFANVQYLNVPANVYGSGTVIDDGLRHLANVSVAASGVGSTHQIDPATNAIAWTLGTGTLNGSPVVPLGNPLGSPPGSQGYLLNNDAWRWFTLVSSDGTTASVNADGVISGVQAGGPVIITGMLGTQAIPGSTTVTVTAPFATPTTPAPTPSLSSANVIALFDSGNVYTPHPVDGFNANFCGGVTEALFPVPSGNSVLRYALNNCTGIVFGDGSAGNTVNTINATAAGMTSFHMDVWSPNPVLLQIQLIDNANPGPSVVGTYVVSAVNIPGFTWTSIDQPFTNFKLNNGSGLTTTDALQQVYLGAASPGMILYVDNVYFYHN